MTTKEQKVVLITGASSGIGEATARLLARNGVHVVLGARRTERLETLVAAIRSEGGSAEYQTLDVTRRADFQAFVEFAVSKFGRVDVIVNNAGVMPLSKLEALKVDEWDWMIDVNIRGVLNGIAAGLPLMKRQGPASSSTCLPLVDTLFGPTSAVYSATKFAVLAISEGLRQENTDIRVTVISPGVTESELADSITDAEAGKGMQEFRRIALRAEAIAKAIAFAIDQPDDVDVNEIIVRPTASPY